MQSEREVAGLTCGQVLEHLPDYVDQALGAELRLGIEGHLRGCDACERFGGRYAEVARALRRELGAADELPPEAGERLARELARALGSGS
jgi:predicted anti-sigma-YlaC factor YlaD